MNSQQQTLSKTKSAAGNAPVQEKQIDFIPGAAKGKAKNENVFTKPPGKQLLSVIPLNPPFDYCRFNTDELKKAVLLPGGDAAAEVYRKISHHQPDTMEIDLVVIAGRWFSVDYTKSFNGGGASSFTNTDPCMHKKVRFAAYENDVTVTAVTTLEIPDEIDKVCYLNTGNAGIANASISAFIETSVSYSTGNNNIIRNSVNKYFIFMNAIDTGLPDYFRSFVKLDCPLRIPAGIIEIDYRVNISASAFVSGSILSVDPADTSKFGVALIDLRNAERDQNLDIITDPLRAWNKAPAGGASVTAWLEFTD